MNSLRLAKQEIDTIVADQIIIQELNSWTPAASSIVVASGNYVRVVRESDNRLHGPYNVIRVDSKEVYVEVDG